MQFLQVKQPLGTRGFLFILKLRKGSFISFLQDEIFLISQASIQLHAFAKQIFFQEHIIQSSRQTIIMRF